jgi:hypothetical protein
MLRAGGLPIGESRGAIVKYATLLLLTCWVSSLLVLPNPRASAQVPAAPAPPTVATLLEDNGEALLKLLTNPTGDPGEGRIEREVTFSGSSSIKIIPMQRFHPHIPGWGYRIVEKPGPDEYRYLRFAWRADGCDGIMLQLHDDADWNVRYTAGADVPGWGSKFVAPRPPGEWVVMTRDLFADFGPRTIRGIALTAFGGRAGYFDHIYLGRSVDDLDRVDATGVRAGPPVDLGPADLDRLWREACGPDAAKAYLAFWTLVANPDKSVPFVSRQLADTRPDALAQQVRRWIGELDSPSARVREAAAERLAQHMDAAAALLKRELEQTPSPEVRMRATRLLAASAARGAGGLAMPDPAERAVRILEYAGDAAGHGSPRRPGRHQSGATPEGEAVPTTGP